MTDITKLPDKWRENAIDASEAGFVSNVYVANVRATELEDAMPKWTKITHDPDTWPEDGYYLWAYRSVDGDWLHATFEVAMMRVIADMAVNTQWRPLCDLDYPPEDK